MNPRTGQVLHRLYLTAVFLLAIPAVLVPVGAVITLIHDTVVVNRAFDCFEKEVGPEEMRAAVKRGAQYRSGARGEIEPVWIETVVGEYGIHEMVEAEASRTARNACGINADRDLYFSNQTAKAAWLFKDVRDVKRGLGPVAAVSAAALAPLLILIILRRWIRWVARPAHSL